MPLKLHQEEMPTINLTSMIDVVFLLLIFFMVGTRFSDNESRISINLPRAALPNAPVNSQNTKTIIVRQDGLIEIDGQQVQLPEVTRLLANFQRTNPSASAVIRPDARVSVQRLIEVQAAVNQSGVRLTSVAVQNNLSR